MAVIVELWNISRNFLADPKEACACLQIEYTSLQGQHIAISQTPQRC